MLVIRVRARPLELVLGLIPVLGFVLVLEEEFTPQSPKLVIEEPPQLFQLIYLQVAEDHLCFLRNQTSEIC